MCLQTLRVPLCVRVCVCVRCWYTQPPSGLLFSGLCWRLQSNDKRFSAATAVAATAIGTEKTDGSGPCLLVGWNECSFYGPRDNTQDTHENLALPPARSPVSLAASGFQNSAYSFGNIFANRQAHIRASSSFTNGCMKTMCRTMMMTLRIRSLFAVWCVVCWFARCKISFIGWLKV